MTELEVLIQQIIVGLSNGMIIALIALGYTMVYGLIELINFAHGDLFMLGSFFALSLVGLLGLDKQGISSSAAQGHIKLISILVFVSLFCGGINWAVDRLAYRPLRGKSRLTPLVSAIGVSFVFLNIGLFWGGLPMEVFGNGLAAASPKDFPMLVSNNNLLTNLNIQFTLKDCMVLLVTVPLLFLITFIVKYTTFGKAVRATAQNPTAAKLMGIDVDSIISKIFMLGGALGGAASVVYALYNNTIYFQMGFRVGLDAFTAAVLGGIGNLTGAMLGGLVIGVTRSLSDQYVAAQWTNTIVFLILILVLVFRPCGLLGSTVKEKV